MIKYKENKVRCSWVNLNNDLYVTYHDEEWGKQTKKDDSYLFEMLVLESFQAGLSWECVLNKRENFRKALDGFDYKKISNYDEKKIEELLLNAGIIRNKRKIFAMIQNAKIYQQIQDEFGSFSNYLSRFTGDQIFHEREQTKSALSDDISRDLQKRGMKFVGTTIMYSYLQAIGVIYSHEKSCYLCKE